MNLLARVSKVHVENRGQRARRETRESKGSKVRREEMARLG